MAKVVFMGTPQFAVESLKKIIEAGHEIIAVVTVPDKPAGRGLKMLSSSVCLYAKENGLPVFQPEKLNDPGFVSIIQTLNPDIIVVVAFRKLPKSIWSIPKYGSFNVHASLLPQYRGAAPMNHAIINGETQTGITTFLLDDNIDTGNIICQQPVEINPTDTLEDLHDKMMVTGASLAIKTIDKLISGDYQPISQSELIPEGTVIHGAPKITKEFCRINWNNTSINIFNKIRGLSPTPCAFTVLKSTDGRMMSIKIFKTEYQLIEDETKLKTPGTVITDNVKYLGISTKDGIIFLKDLQLAGKKRMDIESFLRGNKMIGAVTVSPDNAIIN